MIRSFFAIVLVMDVAEMSLRRAMQMLSIFVAGQPDLICYESKPAEDWRASLLIVRNEEKSHASAFCTGVGRMRWRSTMWEYARKGGGACVATN